LLGMEGIRRQYNGLPEWLRWMLFFPVSLIISVVAWFAIASSARMAGAFAFVLAILHPAIVQVLFLLFVFYTIPRFQLESVLVFIVLRSSLLIFFIASPILSFLGEEQIYDWIFVKELSGEVLTLVASLWFYKELKNKDLKI